eukprot:scpid31426/ scgid5319/ E3 ubiquitin-protein ligase mind-bomb; Mind bomb homolog
MAEVCLGLRVVRGPSWNWTAQDGGEGGVGTVVEIGGLPDSGSPLGTVVVLWDTGNKTNYRCGYDNKFDLRVLDTNCAVGSHHFEVMCDGCGSHSLFGIRWKCRDCPDYDLCSECYHSDKHNLSHRFWMIPFPGAHRKEIEQRQGAMRLTCKGIFPGAKVTRGLDWRWATQDGQQGVVGTVEKLCNCQAVTHRSAAHVAWPNGQRNVYRAGHIGKVDIRCVDLKNGGRYYREHLPILVAERVGETDDKEMSIPLRVGDLAQVAGLDVEIWKIMQEQHGGWSDSMEKMMQQVGEVQRIDPYGGDVFVYYPTPSRTFQFHPAVVTKVLRLRNGDRVKMIDDTSAMKAMLINHGEWTTAMDDYKDQVGIVSGQMPKFDVRVSYESGVRWIFHPGCLVRQRSANGDDFSQDWFTDSGADATDDTLDEQRLLGSALAGVEDPNLQRLLMSWVADMVLSPATAIAKSVQEGDVEKVRRELERHQSHINDRVGEHNQTCLHIAAGLGMTEIMDLLIQKGAMLSAEDKDGDQPIHFAVMGNEPRSIACLARNHADINACNHKAATALHSACFRGNDSSVAELLRLKASVTIQDGAGDTPLHDAVANDHGEIVDMLLDAGAPLAIGNDRGFNIVHHAALKGHHYVLEKIVRRHPEMINSTKPDGWTALHLTAFNSHMGATTVLLQQPGCQINAKTNTMQTPLMLAVEKGASSCVELLVSYGAELEEKDKDGDTALHTAVIRENMQQTLKRIVVSSDVTSEQQSLLLSQIAPKLGLDPSLAESQNAVAIACFLAQEGCSLTALNKKGKTPLDMCSNDKLRALIKKFEKPKGWSPFHGSNRVGGLRGAQPAHPPRMAVKLSTDGAAASSTVPRTTMPSSTVPRTTGGVSSAVNITGGAAGAGGAEVIKVHTPLTECSVCDNKANIRFQPCGHEMLCEACSQRSARCPLRGCKAAVLSKIKLEYEPAPAQAPAAVDTASVAGPDDDACMMCDNKATVTFQPCGHVVTCTECCVHARKCILCKKAVVKTMCNGVEIPRGGAAGRPAPTAAAAVPAEEDSCPICLDNRSNVAFMCGHRTCSECSPKIYECPICRKPITTRIELF